ncbi:MAG: beta-propeller fold lactonase family protein [Acidobacteriia bacterium]|nr:beta-propeller fold lactonase family protein [Terriglobia bacterium]
MRIWCAIAMAATVAWAACAQPASCNAAAAEPLAHIALPAHPFGVAVSQDGCRVFVALMAAQGKDSGIAVLERAQGRVKLARVVPLHVRPAGIVLTHDGKLLIAAAQDSVLVLDTRRLAAGDGEPVLGTFHDGPMAGSIYVNVAADDKLLFVSDEGAAAITVIDLERARAKGFDAGAVVGKVPVGRGPIALTFSPDGRWLYTTSELAPSEWDWPKACKPEGQAQSKAGAVRPEGAVIVVDVAKARTDPAHAAVARAPAGCSPVRLAISPAGDRIYVTARNSNAVLAFDTARLSGDAAHARVGMAPVGTAPVPVAVVDGGKKVIVGNSDRFAGQAAPQTLTVLDAAKISSGAAAVLGSVPAGAFPREMSVSPDGRTLFLTNFGSNSLQVMDVARLPVKQPAAK